MARTTVQCPPITYKPANPAAAMVRPTATIVLAYTGKTQSICLPKENKKSPPAISTAGRTSMYVENNMTKGKAVITRFTSATLL